MAKTRSREELSDRLVWRRKASNVPNFPPDANPLDIQNPGLGGFWFWAWRDLFMMSPSRTTLFCWLWRRSSEWHWNSRRGLAWLYWGKVANSWSEVFKFWIGPSFPVTSTEAIDTWHITPWPGTKPVWSLLCGRLWFSLDIITTAVVRRVPEVIVIVKCLPIS